MVSKALVLLNVFTFCSVINANLERKKEWRAKRDWEKELKIEAALTEESRFKLHPDCEITVNGLKANIEDLREGMEIEFVFSEENVVIKITAKTVPKDKK